MFEQIENKPLRRRILWTAPLVMAGIAALTLRKFRATGDTVPNSATGEEVEIGEFNNSGERVNTTRVKKIVRSDSEWWPRLTPQQYYVTRKHSTDTPFTGTYYQLHQAGIYRCICCDTAVFHSKAKYDSGTGWPSFWEPIAKENVRTSGDPKENLDIGIDVMCKRCDAHLGHIFNDGPQPSGLRYCINESSLRFVPA